MRLYNKHRPVDLSGIVGNKAIVKSVKALHEAGNLPNVVLFSGERGCGKSTMAKIYIDLIGARSQDVVEINCGNDGGVDTGRSISKDLRQRAIGSSHKVYILEEVHKMSSAFQDSLLTTTENAPDYVYFIFCTTNPEKMLSALKSRCTPYVMKKPTKAEVKKLLVNIAKKEDTVLTEDIQSAIISKGESCPRDCVSILHSIIGMSEEDEQLEIIESYVNEESSQAIDLCRAIVDPRVNWGAIQAILKIITDPPETVRYVVLNYMNSTMLKIRSDAKSEAKLNRLADIIDCFSESFMSTGKAGLTVACYRILN